MLRSRIALAVIGLLTVPGVLTASTAGASTLRPNAVSATQPTRILDTRIGLGAPQQPLTLGSTITIGVPAAIAAGASSVVLNLTATDATANGFVKAWPCADPMPATSVLNFTPGHTAANAVMLKLTSAGICLTSNVAVQVIADVSGWYTGTDDFVGSTPNRILDTRVSKNPLAAGQERSLAIAGQPGIGANATMAALNLTVDTPAAAGYLVAYPCGTTTNGSTVNFSAGETVANLTLVGLSSGKVCLRSNVSVQLVVDSYGWSAGAGKLAVQSPTRLLDTRDPAQWPTGIVQSTSTVQLRVAGRAGVPNTADAALLTVTVAGAGGDGFVTVWGCDQTFPLASTINTWQGALRSNLALVKLSITDGTACLQYRSSNGTATHLVVDAVGWSTGGPTRLPPTGVGTLLLPGATTCTSSQPVTFAFCDSFGAANANPLTRSGDLDATVWGVSRTNSLTNWTQDEFNRWPTATMVGCGADQPVTAPNDVKICNGRVYEAVSDQGGQTTLAMYPKQPFDIAGRTGTVTFDVSADSGGPHNAWPEFWWTDQPVPAPHGHLASQAPYAANSFGFAVDGCADNQTGVGNMMITRNFVEQDIPFTSVGCINKGSPTGGLNHFEVRINANRAEVWASDPGSTAVRLIAFADVAMPLTRGVIWMEDIHYNACKPGFGVPQCDHTFAWDNVGFDGPTPYRDLTFDVQDALTPSSEGGVNLGYRVTTDVTGVTAPGVYWTQTPTKQFVAFNWYPWDASVPSVRVNGGAWHDTPWPFDSETFVWRTIAVPVSLSEIHSGSNTIEFKYPTATGTVVSNVNVILIAATTVP